MPKLTQDFNIFPYFDDYDETKSFYKILFRPGYSVQARELTQIQSILQNQIEKTGDVLFQDGSRVSGGELTINTSINSLQVKFAYQGAEINIANFNGRLIEGQTSGARAEVITSAIFTTSTQNTLMINYVDDTLFLDGEVISTIDAGTTYFGNVAGPDEGLAASTELVTSVASGLGSTASITEGLFYLGGYFIFVPEQSIILDQFGNIPTYRIGLDIVETLVDSVEDTSLLDNAIGSPNYTAPGANRYKISLNLLKKNFYEEGERILPSGVTFSVNTRDNKSGTVNITTATDHNLKVGDVIVVNGSTFDEYNGKHTITAIGSPTQFSYFILGKPTSPAPGDITYIKGITDPIEKNSDIDFIELLRIENGEKTEEIKYPVLGDIEKTMARRTFDASGDFTVRPFSLNVVTHKLRGTSTDRVVSNTATFLTGNGTNFITDVNVGDVIFLSGNVNRTATVDNISNTTFLTLTSGQELGDGSSDQKIGVDSKITAELGPGKAYIKGYEYESVATEFVDVNKARDTRAVVEEKQGLSFGPVLRVTDYFSNTAIDATTGLNQHNDLYEVHCVKWPSTELTDATSVTENIINHHSNGEAKYVGIDHSTTSTIANTKIGTVRLRQLDFYTGRPTTVNSVYASNINNPTTARTVHRVFPSVFDAHVFDFKFSKLEGTVSAASSNASLISIATDSSPIVNTYFGATITVTTNFLGIVSTDTRNIISYSGDNNGMLSGGETFTAELDQPLTQTTQSDSTYSIDFGVKDIKSLVKVDTTGGASAPFLNAGMNIDISGKTNSLETGNTIVLSNGDDERKLIFPFQNKAIASTSNRKFKLKRRFVGTVSGGDGTVRITAPSSINEKFYPGVDQTLSGSLLSENYIVRSIDGGVNEKSGEQIELTNESETGLFSSREAVLSAGATTLTLDVRSDHGACASFDYSSTEQVEVIATMMNDNADIGTGTIGKKTLVQSNVTTAIVSSADAFGTSGGTSNAVQATAGQVVFGLTIDSTPGAVNSLRISDVKKLVAIVDSRDPGANVSNAMISSAVASVNGGTSSIHDVTNNFIFDTGQKDNFYDYGTITLKPGQDKPIGQVVALVDYYTHEGVGPFTVDSYTYSGTGNTPYTEIPSFTSPFSGQKFELRDVIDFRPKRLGINDLNSSGAQKMNDLADFTNPAVFNEKMMPDHDFTFDADYSHYLPRKDKIVIGRDRQFKVIEGVSDLNPSLPPDDEDSLTLYNLSIPAYTFNASDVEMRYIDNRRYTMRDIGKLERRIENLEYYVSLSLLEKEADGLVITDSNNNDRFKNGILVDPMSGHNIGDVFNLDYKAAIDFESKFLRPTFKSDNMRLKYDSSDNSTLVNNSGIITLPFTANTFVNQPFTGSLESKNTQKTLKINPFSIQSYMGSMFLDPISDSWYDNKSSAEIKVNLEGQYDNWNNLPGADAHGTHWNDWEEIWSGKQVNNDVKEGIRDTGDVALNDRKAKTTSQQKTLSGLKSGNVPEKIMKTIGNKVVNISIVPVVREQTITFVAKGLKPRKNVFAFFGDTQVTANVKQASLITLSNVSSSNVFSTKAGNFENITIQGSGADAGNTATVVHMTDRDSTNGCSILVTNMSNELSFGIGDIIKGDESGANGTISDVTNYEFTDTNLSVLADGVTAGVFNIPKGKFSGTDNLFRLCDDPDNITSLTTSVAESPYYTKGVLDTVNETGIVSTRPMILRREDVTDERVTKVTTDTRQSVSTKWYNPMAQSFFIDKNQYPSGLFLDSIVLFFNRKTTAVGSSVPVTLQIRPMINGLPSSSLVVPGSEVVLSPARITANTSVPVANSSGGFPEATLGNSSTANRSALDIGSRTIFKFDFPVFLTPDEYAIVLLTNSSQYQIYGFELGAKHTGTDRKVTKQPYVGSFFKPSNAGTWEPKIDEGLMFQVNRCEFTSANGYARFDNFVTSQSNTVSNTVMDSFKLVSDTVEFKDTFSEFKYYATSKDAEVKDSAIKLTPNKNLDLKQQKQITYTTDTTNTQYQNSFQMNVYFETNNNLISPVLDTNKFSVISIENDINNGSLSNSDVVVTNFGSGYDSDVYSLSDINEGPNTNVFTVSSPDVGDNVATLGCNVHSNGSINQVFVVNAGAGYLTTPTVTVNDGGPDDSLEETPVEGTGLVVNIIGEGAKGENMTTADKTHSRGGNLRTRYITRRVTLEENFDAKDIRVYVNAYKPRGADIHVYYKILSDSDVEPFDEKPYVLMEQETTSSSFSLNENDVKTFTFRTKDQFVSYTDSEGQKYNDFKTFAIKIGFTLNRDDQTTFIGIPRVSDVRAIALDSVGIP